MDEGEQLLELPADLVQKSPGFSFDLGGTNAKIVYRSKEEYEKGVPKNSKHEKKGVVHLVLMNRHRLEDLIELLLSKCDIKRGDDDLAHVTTTGLHANFNKDRLEKDLKIRMNNVSEMELFSQAFAYLAQNTSEYGLFEPLSQTGLEAGKLLMDVSMGYNKFLGSEFVKEDVDYSLSGSWFPCLIVLAGSGNVILQVQADGSFSIVDFPLLGGRFLQGFAAICCGVKSYGEMQELVSGSDGRTVDTYVSDEVTAPQDAEECDAYSAISDNKYDIRLLPFGKGMSFFKFGDADWKQFFHLYILVRFEKFCNAPLKNTSTIL